MKNLCILFCFAMTGAVAQKHDWKPADPKIPTRWASQVDPENPHADYPRPQMTRNEWYSLNGLWDYSIQPMTEATMATKPMGKIVVPFAVESSLSGVGKRVGKENVLWYKRMFSILPSTKNKTVMLHFGAVDWKCEVFVNGRKAGEHQGGYDPFSLNISQLIKAGGEQELIVKVWDPSNDGPQPRGKQVNNPRGIWYTPVTGIWQTVWFEVLPLTYIETIRVTPDIDKKVISVTLKRANTLAGDVVRISALDGTTQVSTMNGTGDAFELPVPNPRLWSPSDPFLYDLKVEIVRKGKTVDQVKSYFGMRKISMATDRNGMQRLLLNNEVLFQYGPLDQGWWPDGLYTAPTDEALRFDIEKTKEMGFNMIRKHVKVEPARWYYHCDKLGMLVWQDMPSGDLGNRWNDRPGVIGPGTDKERTPESESIYRSEWKAIMDANYNSPSIVVWVPFNEAWGQFKTEEIANWTMSMDPSRLVNSASGGNFTPSGHIFDLHNYPEPAMPDPRLFGGKQALVLGEFGGLGLPLENHTWQAKDNWGYQSFKNADELIEKYLQFIDKLVPMIDKGLAAAVYTQTTDVEVETNGLMSYDREVMKMPVNKLAEAHLKLTKPNR